LRLRITKGITDKDFFLTDCREAFRPNESRNDHAAQTKHASDGRRHAALEERARRRPSMCAAVQRRELHRYQALRLEESRPLVRSKIQGST